MKRPSPAPLFALLGVSALVVVLTSTSWWLGAWLLAVHAWSAWSVWRSYCRVRDSYVDMELAKLKFMNSPQGRVYTFVLYWGMYARSFDWTSHEPISSESSPRTT